MTYSKKTKDYIKATRNYLVSQYGDVQPEWEMLLELLKDDFELYKRIMDIIEVQGISTAPQSKNPLLSTAKDLQATMFKIIQHFGISPYSAAKIKMSQPDDTNDFIDNLLTDDDN